jgi:PRTRC genetic system ThiF family protein
MRAHFTDNYLLNPQHPVTVNLIGCGGTGSQVLTCLARIDTALRALEHPGLHVTAYDPDTVEESNIGRQLFSPSDIGQNKAVCLVTRVNRFFAIGWEAVRKKYNGQGANILITCTDNIQSRLDAAEAMARTGNGDSEPYQQPKYWLDMGNAQTTGQAILGSMKIEQPKSAKYETVSKLPFVTEMFDYATIKEEDSGPSCSMEEALERQDLFINSSLAQLGCDLHWKLFRNGMIEHHGLYLNLDTMKVNPIGV